MDVRIKYLDLRVATLLCATFQHLVGKPFHLAENEKGIVQHVIIAPYSKILQWQFVRQFLCEPQLSLDIAHHKKFDVVVISDQFVKYRHALYIKGLRTYLSEHSIPFDIKKF